MKERSPSSWSAEEAGASWAWGRGLAHAKAAGGVTMEKEPEQRGMAWRQLHRTPGPRGAAGPPDVRTQEGVGEGSGSELLHAVLGFAQYGGAPGTSLLTAGMHGAQNKRDSDKSRGADARVTENSDAS